MLGSNRQTDKSGDTTSANPGLETIEKWLRGLPPTDVKELSEALAGHHAERLSRFRTKFQAWLERSG